MKKTIILSYLIFCSLFLISESRPSIDLEVIGEWKFVSIRYSHPDSTDQDIKPISEEDFLFINSDSTFSYNLNEISLNATGKWGLNEDTLIFYYDLPSDTTRNYFAYFENPTQLVLVENGVRYVFNSVVIGHDIADAEYLQDGSFSKTLLGIIVVLAFLIGLFWSIIFVINSFKK